MCATQLANKSKQLIIKPTKNQRRREISNGTSGRDSQLSAPLSMNQKIKYQARGAAETPLRVRGLVPAMQIEFKDDLHLLLKNHRYQQLVLNLEQKLYKDINTLNEKGENLLEVLIKQIINQDKSEIDDDILRACKTLIKHKI